MAMVLVYLSTWCTTLRWRSPTMCHIHVMTVQSYVSEFSQSSNQKYASRCALQRQVYWMCWNGEWSATIRGFVHHLQDPWHTTAVCPLGVETKSHPCYYYISHHDQNIDAVTQSAAVRRTIPVVVNWCHLQKWWAVCWLVAHNILFGAYHILHRWDVVNDLRTFVPKIE